MKITNTMSWSEMQETDAIDDNQAIQDLSLMEITDAFGLLDYFLKYDKYKITIIIAENIIVEIESRDVSVRHTSKQSNDIIEEFSES